MLQEFEKAIQAYNTSTQPLALSWKSGHGCYYPPMLVSQKNKFLKDWYREQGCNISSKALFASLETESKLASSGYSSAIERAIALLGLGLCLVISSALLGAFIHPGFLLLPLVVCAIAYLSISLLVEQHEHIIADNYIAHEKPAVSKSKWQSIFATDQTCSHEETTIPCEPSAPSLALFSICGNNGDEYAHDEVPVAVAVAYNT